MTNLHFHIQSNRFQHFLLYIFSLITSSFGYTFDVWARDGRKKKNSTSTLYASHCRLQGLLALQRAHVTIFIIQFEICSNIRWRIIHTTSQNMMNFWKIASEKLCLGLYMLIQYEFLSNAKNGDGVHLPPFASYTILFGVCVSLSHVLNAAIMLWLFILFSRIVFFPSLSYCSFSERNPSNEWCMDGVVDMESVCVRLLNFKIQS